MSRSTQRGFSLVESLISLAILTLVMSGVYGVLVHNSRISKSQRLIAETQANARACLSLVVARLRSAGWDPMNAGITGVVLDPDTSDDVSQIEIFADLESVPDGLTDGVGEQVLIRHVDDRVEWRLTNDTSLAYDVVAMGISNDANGDGTPEAMFVPDSTTDPTRITVRVTAETPVLDPVTGEIYRHTVTSDVVLRKFL